MSILAPIRIPVCNADGVIVERVNCSRLVRLTHAPNAAVVRRTKRKGGGVVRILLKDVGDDSLEDSKRGNPRAFSHKNETLENPPRCWTLKRIPSSTEDIFRAVILSLAA